MASKYKVEFIAGGNISSAKLELLLLPAFKTSSTYKCDSMIFFFFWDAGATQNSIRVAQVY